MSLLDDLQYKKDVDWEDVFDVWRRDEADSPGWIHTATKVKGWPDWESWRRYMADQLHLSEYEWRLYEFTDPTKQIPAMQVGPFRSWQHQLPEPMRLQVTFHDYVAERLEWVKENERVQNLLQNFPSQTQLIGLYLEDQDRLMCLEGSHRSAAVALSVKEGVEIDFGLDKPSIAVASISGNSRQQLARAMGVGSENPERKNESL